MSPISFVFSSRFSSVLALFLISDTKFLIIKKPLKARVRNKSTGTIIGR